MPTTAEVPRSRVQSVAVGGQRLRIAITSGPNGPGREPRIPLLMHRLIRGSRLHVYPGGHLGLLTEAAGLAPVVDGFLSGP